MQGTNEYRADKLAILGLSRLGSGLLAHCLVKLFVPLAAVLSFT